MIDQRMTIHHCKGDTEAFVFTAQKDGVMYHIPTDETYFFTVKRNVNSDILIQKEVTGDGTPELHLLLNKEDTKAMPYGKYVWDLRCRKGKDGISTPISQKDFILCEVVGDNV